MFNTIGQSFDLKDYLEHTKKKIGLTEFDLHLDEMIDVKRGYQIALTCDIDKKALTSEDRTHDAIAKIFSPILKSPAVLDLIQQERAPLECELKEVRKECDELKAKLEEIHDKALAKLIE